MDARSRLDELIRASGDSYARISALIGRNDAYIQQFIRRGTPRLLAEEDRRTLARFFRVPEQQLGGPQGSAMPPDLIAVPRLDVAASAGPGAEPGAEAVSGRLAFDPRWLRTLSSGGAAMLSAIRVRGDSMEPALADGDEILVDRAEDARRIRDGIYVLRLDGALLVKRLALPPPSGAIEVLSDNPAYPTLRCPADEVEIVGRVVWISRRLA